MSPQALSPADVEAQLKQNLARLSADDRQLAEEQKFCPIMPDVKLGEMGLPQKIVLKGETFFVCCKNCVGIAKEDPDEALTQLKELRQTRAKERPGKTNRQ